MTMERPPMRMAKFRKEMERVISSKQHIYGDFRDYKLGDFTRHLRQEYDELLREIEKQTPVCPECGTSKQVPNNLERIAQEALDLANMSYMIWWISTQDGSKDA